MAFQFFIYDEPVYESPEVRRVLRSTSRHQKQMDFRRFGSTKIKRFSGEKKFVPPPMDPALHDIMCQRELSVQVSDCSIERIFPLIPSKEHVSQFAAD